MLVTILVLVICRFNRNSIALSLSYVIGAGGYVCTMLILYLIAFDKYEAPRLASFDRYMNTYLYMGTTLVLMISIYINSCKNHRAIRYLAVVLILCLFVEPGNLKQLKPRFKIEDEPMKVMIINQFNDYKLEREDLNNKIKDYEEIIANKDNEIESLNKTIKCFFCRVFRLFKATNNS